MMARSYEKWFWRHNIPPDPDFQWEPIPNKSGELLVVGNVLFELRFQMGAEMI